MNRPIHSSSNDDELHHGAEGVQVVLSDQGQSERVLTFLATWLEDPMVTAIMVEHHGTGDRVTLDTLVLEGLDDDDDDDETSSRYDDDGSRGGRPPTDKPSPRARAKGRRRRLLRRRPDPEDVMMHRFGQVIGDHAVALLHEEVPRYALVAKAGYRSLGECQIWARPPSPSTRGRGGMGGYDDNDDHNSARAIVTLGQQPAAGMILGGGGAGPRGRPSPYHQGRGFGAAAAAPSFGVPVRNEEMWRQNGDHEVQVIGMLTLHVQQLMKQQERTTEASLGAMASQCDMLMERNRILEAERTETLAMQRRIHDQLLSSEAERYRMKVHASVEEDIQRAVDAEERSKNRLLEQGLERLLPTLKMALGQLSGADVVMRLLNEFPDGVLEQVLPMLSPAQREILDNLGVLDAHIDEAALAHVGNPAFDAVIAPEVERRHRAAAAAAPAAAPHAQPPAESAHPPPAAAPVAPVAPAAAAADNEAMAEAPPPPNAQRVPTVMAHPPSASPSPSPPPPPVAATAARARPSPPPPPSEGASFYGLPSPTPSDEPPAPPPPQPPPSKTWPSSDASSRVPSSPASASVSPSPPPPPSRPCPPTKETTFVVRGALPSPSPDDSS